VFIACTGASGAVSNLSQLRLETSTPTASLTSAVDSPATPRPPIYTSTGKAKTVETLANQQVRLTLTPDDPAMKKEFVIGDWSQVTVLYYWAGLQTPTPVAASEKLNTVMLLAVGREVSVGYSATEPPTVILVSLHKKVGDPQ